MSPRVQPLDERIRRYERIMALSALTPPLSLTEIGQRMDPPLSKERVRQIKASPPKRAGRPVSDSRVAHLRTLLGRWESRLLRAQRAADATRIDTAQARIVKLTGELAELEGRR